MGNSDDNTCDVHSKGGRGHIIWEDKGWMVENCIELRRVNGYECAVR